MLTWGQRWLRPAESDSLLNHRPYGQEVQAVLSCGSCGDAITRDDVALS
jgi:hypothetical protein